MAWLAVDNDGSEYIYQEKPFRYYGEDKFGSQKDYVELPKGSIEKLIGRKLTWDDNPQEI